MDKKVIITLIKFSLVIIFSHFLLTTIIRFGIGEYISILNSNIVNIIKDTIIAGLLFTILIYLIKNNLLIKSIKKQRTLLLTLIIIIIISIIGTINNKNNINFFIIGFKYDIWPFIIISIISLISLNKKELHEIYSFFLKIIKIIIIASVSIAIIRFIYPNLLTYIGFGPLGDWKAGEKPPVFYKTGVDGIQRISGIFSGPNNFSFFLIGFGAIILISILKKKLNPIWGILYLLLLIGTLSRSAFIAFSFEIFLIASIFLIKFKEIRNKIYFFIGILFIIIIGAITYLYKSGIYDKIILRASSTNAHFERAIGTIKYIKDSPILGYGIGTAGPSAHYTNTNIIPESWILQIIYELGIIGAIFWFIFLILIILNLKKNLDIYSLDSEINILRFGIIIGLLGLLVQGLVLHSFEDAMLALSLSIIIGISLSTEN